LGAGYSGGGFSGPDIPGRIFRGGSDLDLDLDLLVPSSTSSSHQQNQSGWTTLHQEQQQICRLTAQKTPTNQSVWKPSINSSKSTDLDEIDQLQ
ncbi:hypothetical protein, partial [Escherichia coli]|uniref:hypothetical protein n=1 Tax=Escherichia coli TaxID=562 RepID=UPI003B76D821